jgi:hypothetical protein
MAFWTFQSTGYNLFQKKSEFGRVRHSSPGPPYEAQIWVTSIHPAPGMAR